MKSILTLNELKEKLKLSEQPSRSPKRTSTGFPELDDATGGGFVRVGINEFLLRESGCGTLEFLLRLFRKRAAQEDPLDERPFQLAWIHPLLNPYPPAAAQCGPPLAQWLFVTPNTLQEQLWALEQILRAGEHQCVLAPIKSISDHQLRRLGMAALEGRSALYLMRQLNCSKGSSASNLRVLTSAAPSTNLQTRCLQIEVLRCRGVSPRPSLCLEWSVDSLDEPVVS